MICRTGITALYYVEPVDRPPTICNFEFVAVSSPS